MKLSSSPTSNLSEGLLYNRLTFWTHCQTSLSSATNSFLSNFIEHLYFGLGLILWVDSFKFQWTDRRIEGQFWVHSWGIWRANPLMQAALGGNGLEVIFDNVGELPVACHRYLLPSLPPCLPSFHSPYVHLSFFLCLSVIQPQSWTVGKVINGQGQDKCFVGSIGHLSPFYVWFILCKVSPTTPGLN